ncbi:patatin-like phospholipase family protein [Bacillus marinisedimentorum]|uniref:patatin-like phospholipase family protein n=1 Tax=Bacillus marinisedimentorum TaxID=1821260 RepID=UPI001FE0702F|nr:patatin-like phospholipase family protein [Bacillus marinisedimentorum]
MPKIGLALGSGGARGFAHLGVLKVLKDHNIPVHSIAGSSMGALVGALYGAGQSIEDLYKIARAFQRKYYLDFTVPRMGFIAGNKVKDLIRIFTYNKMIENLTPGLAVVATDLHTGERVVFKSGNAADAVRASISIPGIFVPENIGGRLLIDGGVVDRVPVSVAMEMDMDMVIAVDVAHFGGNEEVRSIFDVILQSIDIMQGELVRYQEINADIMIRPRVDKFSSRAFTDLEEIISIGEKETVKMIPAITAAIEAWKEKRNG